MSGRRVFTTLARHRRLFRPWLRFAAALAGVEALANTLRAELASSGAKVGVAYFAELDTDMTQRAFGTEAASRLRLGARRSVAPMEAGVDAIERAIARRSRRAVAPRWVAIVLPLRMLAQRLIDRVASRGLDEALQIARLEQVPLTTDLRDDSGLPDGSPSGERTH